MLARSWATWAIVGGSADLDTFIADMRGRDQLDLRQDQAQRTLGDLAHATRMRQSQVEGQLAGEPGRPASRLTRL